MGNDIKKSKYLNTNEKRVSKYRKEDNAEEIIDEKSPENEGTLKEYLKEYRKSVLTPKRAKELYEEESLSLETDIDTEVVSSDELINLDSEEVDSENVDIEDEENDGRPKKAFNAKSNSEINKTKRNKTKLKKAIFIAIFTVIATVIQFFTIHVPFTPQLLNVEFSVLPELLTSIAYGPLYAIIVCLIKNIIHFMIVPSSAVSDITNFLLDSVFLFIAGWLYTKYKYKKSSSGHKIKIHRKKRILFSSTVGAIISLIPQFFITRFIAYPLLVTYYSDRGVTNEYLLSAYQATFKGIANYLPETLHGYLPTVHNISEGIIFVNLPITLAKLLIVSFVVSIFYKYISSYLHNRKKKNKQKTS